jgi:hypothetical protein
VGITAVHISMDGNTVEISTPGMYAIGTPGGMSSNLPAGSGPSAGATQIYLYSDINCETAFNAVATGFGVLSLLSEANPVVSRGAAVIGMAAGWAGQAVCK